MGQPLSGSVWVCVCLFAPLCTFSISSCSLQVCHHFRVFPYHIIAKGLPHSLSCWLPYIPNQPCPSLYFPSWELRVALPEHLSVFLSHQQAHSKAAREKEPAWLAVATVLSHPHHFLAHPSLWEGADKEWRVESGVERVVQGSSGSSSTCLTSG